MAAGSEELLPGVDEVEWYRYSHAYGVATDVSDLLKQAAGDEPRTAWSAVRDLSDRLLRADLAHSAAPAAAPFLIRLAAVAPGSDVRSGAVLLLTDLAAAREGDPATARRLLAVLSGQRTALGRLLDHDDPAVRAAAAGLAGRLVPPPAEWAPRLRMLRDAADDDLAHANFAVAASLAEGKPPDRQDVELAAAASFEVAVWRERRLSGLLGMRLSPPAAARLGALLARLSVAELAEKK